MTPRKLIAFTGYARSGKDTAASPLVARGYTRVAFGDIIKGQVDQLCRVHLGFSAFTENDAQKKLIRGLLEHWGDANYNAILKAFMESLPERAVNTRLVRLNEAEQWVKRGGVIYEIQRPGVKACSRWEEDRLSELRSSGMISDAIIEEDKEVLKDKVCNLVFGRYG